MANEKSKKILDDNYPSLLKNVVAHIILYDEQNEARELSSRLFKAVSDNQAELKLKPALLFTYQEALSQLKFIAVPLLEETEIIGLIKNNFCLQFDIENYDLLKKISLKLLNIIVVEDRDKFKDSLRRAIEENTEKIIANHEIKMIKDWLKDYIIKTGLNNVDKLVKIQYLVTLKNDQRVREAEYDRLVVLFNFYDYLNLSSEEPEGFDESPPVAFNGKSYIFRKGVLEEVINSPDLIEARQLLGEDISEKNNLEARPIDKDQPVFNDQTMPTLTELEEIIGNYRPGSLEYKAIQQEIKRLKATGSKKPDVKK